MNKLTMQTLFLLARNSSLAILTLLLMIYPFAMSSAKTQKALDATSWRDDKTGDWILSIYPEGVIYDCKFWEYTDRNDKSGKLILHNDYDENLSIKFGKEKEGKCSFKIGSDKPRILSRISGTTLPAYPSKDYRNKFVDTGYQSEDSVTISGWVRGLQSEEIEHQGKEIKVYYSPFDPVKSIPAKLDSIGKFSITFPVLNSSRIVIDAKTVGFVFPVEPGKKYFLLIDLKGDKLITMSEDARIQNELLSHIQTVPSFELGKYYYNFIDKSNNWLESMNASIDSLKKAEPTLSDLALSYLQENALASTALSLGNLRINYPAYKFPQHESDYLRDTFFGIMTQPVSLYPIYYYFLMSFVESELLNSDYTLMPKNGASYSIFFIPKKVLENVKTEIDFLNDCIRDGSFNFMFSLPDTIKNTHQRIQDKAKEILNTDGLSPEEEFSYKDLLCRVDVLNDLNASSEIIDVYLMGYYFDQMDHNLAPLSNVVINSLDSLISSPSIREMILHKSNQYEKLVNKSKSFDLNINKGVEMSEIVEGKEVFEKIVAPYKGKFVLIDIWGTWCVPCRKAMKDFDKEYEALSPYGVAFLFLANNSDDEVIKTVATDYNITGKDVHHYNLPDPQQRALEDYLKVTGYPTYILVDPSGQIVDTPVDARDLKSLEDVIKKHSLPTQSK